MPANFIGTPMGKDHVFDLWKAATDPMTATEVRERQVEHSAEFQAALLRTFEPVVDAHITALRQWLAGCSRDGNNPSPPARNLSQGE